MNPGRFILQYLNRFLIKIEPDIPFLGGFGILESINRFGDGIVRPGPEGQGGYRRVGT